MGAAAGSVSAGEMLFGISPVDPDFGVYAYG